MIAPEVAVEEQDDAQTLETLGRIELAAQREELRESQRRAHLAMRGRRARRSSVLTDRAAVTEAGRDNHIDLPLPEYLSAQPDVGRAVRRRAGIRAAVGLGNQPYRRTEPKRLSKKARRREEGK